MEVTSGEDAGDFVKMGMKESDCDLNLVAGAAAALERKELPQCIK